MKQKLIFGGYTRRLNQGIHEAYFNPEKGQLEDSRLIFKISNPTYLCTNADQSIIFSLYQDGNQAGVIALGYKEDQWFELDRCLASKVNGCHIAYYDQTSTLYICNYHEGIIDVYSFISNQLQHVQKVELNHNSKFSNKQPVRMHYTSVSPNGEFLYACNLGQDSIEIFKLQSNGLIQKISQFPTIEGMGPRHFVYHPHLPLIYVIGEYNNAVSIIRYNQQGVLSELDSVPIIPDKLLPGATGAAIKITKDGKFLYTSTRYSNYISVFTIDKAGYINRVQYIDSVGQIPRDFCLDDTERFLIVPHQDSDFVSIFEREPLTGKLQFINNDVEVPESVCIIPLQPEK